jgi:hypothetical protein
LPRNCFITGSGHFEKAHVISKGSEISEFINAYHRIYVNSEYSPGFEDIQNIVHLREDLHRGPMDSLNLPKDLRIRRIGFDFINRKSYVISAETYKIESFDWISVPDVRPEYFAWSNKKCMKKLRKFMRGIDPRLTNFRHWVDE